MKSMSQLLVAFGLVVGVTAGAQAAPITGGTTKLTLTSASTFAMLGATFSPLGTATLSSAKNPVATFPITGGSTSPSGDIIQDVGSGLEISASPVIVDTRNYLINTVTEVIDADVSVNGGTSTNLALFKLGSKGLSNVPLTLTATAVNALNAAFGINVLTTSTPIGTLTASPTVKGSPVPEPATTTVIGVALLALAGVKRRARVIH